MLLLKGSAPPSPAARCGPRGPALPQRSGVFGQRQRLQASGAKLARPGRPAVATRIRSAATTSRVDKIKGSEQYQRFTSRKRLSAWSPLSSLVSVSKLLFVAGSATAAAWFAHPHLLNIAAHVLHLDFKDSVTAFQTSFFSFLSLVFAIYSGNTMAFLYDRQKQVVTNLFEECMALEELLEESVNALGPDARDILAQIRVYIEEEILAPENQSPPLGEGHALAAIRAKARNYRRSGTEVQEILLASQRVAHAQSTRQASACRLLPPIHWALLYTIGLLFVSTFILFETGGSFSNEGRHILFTTLCGLMSFVLLALRDLANSSEGVYNGTALLDERLGYIRTMLSKYEKLPVKTGGNTTSLLVGTSVAPAAMEEFAERKEAEEATGVAGVLHAVTDKVADIFARDDAAEGSNGATASSEATAATFQSEAAPPRAAEVEPQPAQPTASSYLRPATTGNGNGAAPAKRVPNIKRTSATAAAQQT